MTDIQRFGVKSSGISERPDGIWARYSDYAAMKTRLEAEIAALRLDRDKGAKDYCALMERYDAATQRADRAEPALVKATQALENVQLHAKSEGDQRLFDFVQGILSNLEIPDESTTQPVDNEEPRL